MDFEWQYLEKGKALCGKVFPNFVDTWKRVLDVLANAKGDADVDETQGHIKIDRSDPAHPVIRYVTPDTSADGGGSGGDGSGGDEDEETDDVVTSANGATGDVNVIGGKGIEVSTDGQTIKVTWNKDKEEEDEDPNDDDGDEPSNPCDHDSEGGSEGGVEAGGGIGGGGGGTGDDEGGVPAGGGESHTGDDNCNCG